MKEKILIGVLTGVLSLFVSTSVHAQTHLPSSILNLQSSRQYDILFHEALRQRLKGRESAAFDLLSRCIEIDSMAPEAYFFRAQYFAEMRQPERALSDYRRAAELAPDNQTVLEELAHAYMTANRFEEAVAVVEHMYDLDQGREDLLRLLYRLYLEVEDYGKAIGALDRMELIDGRTEATALAKSGLYIQMDDTDRALTEIKVLAEEHPHDMNYRTLYANTLMMNDRDEEAYELLKEVLAVEPDNARAQAVMRNYYISNEDKAAADSITRCILLNPKTAMEDKVNQLRQLIGESEQTGGDSTQVLLLFDEMLAQPDVDPDIAEFRAAYMDLKKMPRDSVVKAYDYVLQLAPDRASSRLQLVQYAWEDEDNQRIIDLCQAARQYNPDEMAFYYYQGMAYYRQEDTDHALEAFQNGIRVIGENSSPEIVSDFYAVMGDLLHAKGREAEAFAAYDSCLQWQPDNIGCLNNYAYYLSVKGVRLKEAEEMSYKTIKAEPDNATYLDTYAWILFMQGRYAEAKVYIEQALQYDENVGPEVTEHAGDIYAMCGETDKAVEQWEKALLQVPDKTLLAKKVKKRKYIK